MYKDERPIGLFKGFSPTSRELEVEIIVPHPSTDLPKFGEFILIEMQNDLAAVGRIIHYHPTGPLSTIQGESYLAEMGRAEQEIPETIRDLVLRYSMRAALLGMLKRKSSGFEFVAGIRSLARLGMPVRRPGFEALKFLANVNLDLENPDSVVFGNYALAVEVFEDVKVHFSIDRLKSRRTFVFARAGYGKSNLIKYLLSKLYETPPDVGLLIFDPEGEYALPQTVGDKVIPGLASLPSLRKRMEYFTLRGLSDEFKDIYRGSVKVNFCDFSAREILEAFVTPEKHDQVWANWLKGLKPQNWGKLVKLLASKRYRASQDEISDAIGLDILRKENWSIDAIKNNIIHCIDRLHDPKSNLAGNLLENLGSGKIMVVDISLLSGEDGLGIAELLLQKVFTNNVTALTAQEGTTKTPTLVVLEEAQAILGARNLSDKSIFVRWVKEGRKYDLGAVLITQQPGSIAHEILSQGDNFFVMHMLNQNDLEVLRRVNAHYAQDILDQIRNEPIKGNCFFWSAPDQPYVISAKVLNFDEIVKHSQIMDAATTEKAVKTKVKLTPLARACVNTVNSDPQLWVFKVKGKEQCMVSLDFFKIRLRQTHTELEDGSIDNALIQLGWKKGAKATLALSRGSEEVIVFPMKHWKPRLDKVLRKEIILGESGS